VDLIVLFATWTVPALYTWQLAADQLPASIFHVYMSNPLAVAVDRFQEATWRATAENPLPPPEHMTVYTLVALGICAALLVLGQLVFRRFERRFAQEL
jgi:ABC-2 type transport system permease protein